MSGVSSQLTFDTAPLHAVFTRLREVGGDPHAALDAIGGVLVGNVQARFDAEAGPGGVPWVQSLRAKLSGGQTMSDTGRLKASWTHKVEGNAVEWGTNVIYAGPHQRGATIVPVNAKALAFKGADGRPAFVKKVVLPARPMVGWDEVDQEDTRDVLVGIIERATSGGGAAS